MPKHALDSAPETPSKRRCNALSAPALPARPSDSPSNPFGRKRVRTLVRSLPPPTSFSKHLPLRFQLVRTDRPYSRLYNDVHRIVQIPTNYTIMHLRCLIALLFGGSRSSLLQGEDHSFEVKRKIQLYSTVYKPGQVKSGQTWAKLSSAKDPCRYRPESSLAKEEGASGVGKGDGGEEESGEWKWHAEEDFTLERAWPKGRELYRAIVYHHNRTTQVHITVNTSPLPKRKGESNVPYVFSGQGIVNLSPLPIPKLVFDLPPQHDSGASTRNLRSNTKPSSSPNKDEQNVFNDSDESEANDTDDSLDDHEPDDAHAEIDPDYFNETKTFPHFFSRCQRLARSQLQFGSSFGQEYAFTSSEDEQASDAESVTSNAFMTSSSPSKHPEDYSSPATSLFGSVPPTTKSKAREKASPPPTSSPGPSSPISSPVSNKASSSRRTPLFVASSPGNVFEPSTNLSHTKRRHSSLLHNLPFHPSPSGFPKYTPLPARGKLHRMRIKRIEKRVERMKSLEWLKVPDEDEEKEKKKKEAEERKRKEKDEKEKLKQQLLVRKAVPGGVLEMGVRRGKWPLPKASDGQKPKLNFRASSKWHPFGDHS
ncbi:hypothetical protein F5887DRAFT_1158904 [Amanita rubescens]|nr:hypothetical protein F5887DRAFT_1158904 [Amanita rubescens]